MCPPNGTYLNQTNHYGRRNPRRSTMDDERLRQEFIVDAMLGGLLIVLTHVWIMLLLYILYSS